MNDQAEDIEKSIMFISNMNLQLTALLRLMKGMMSTEDVIFELKKSRRDSLKNNRNSY